MNCYCREGRQGIDLVKDDVEVCLDTEVENIRNIQERMRETLDISNSQLDNNLRKQVQLQEDLDNKDLALEIDKICFQLRNNSKNIALQPGVENIDASGSEPESWRKFSCKNRFDEIENVCHISLHFLTFAERSPRPPEPPPPRSAVTSRTC